MAQKLSPSPSTLVPVLHSPSPKAPLSPTITLSTPELYEGDRRYSAILVLPNGVSTGDMDMEPEIGDGEILDGVSKAIVLNDKMKEMTETTNDGMNGISGLHTQNDIYSSSWNDDVEVSHTESSLSPNQLKSTTVHPKAVTAGDITAANDYSESLPSNRPINDSGLPRTRPVIAQAIVYTLPHSNPAIPLAGAGAPPTLLPIMEPSSSLPESANSSGLLPVPSAISPNQITDSLPNSSNNYATSPNSIHAPIFKRQNPRSDIAILQYKTGDNGWKQSSNRTQGVFLFTHVDSPHDSPISTPRSRSREFDRDISQDIGIDELSVSLKTKLNKEKPKKYKVRTGKSVLEGDPHWRRKSFDDQRFQPRSHSLSCSENAPSAQSRTQHQQNIRPHDTSLHVSQRLSPPPVDLDSSSESLDDDPESELTKRKKYDNQRFELRSNSPLLTSPSTLKIKNTASRSNSSEFQSPTDEHSLAASANNNSAHHDDHSSHLWSVFGHGHSHDRSTELENKRTNLFARLLHLNSINPDSTGAPPASAKPPPDSNSASRQDGVNTPSQKLASESSSSQGIKTENGTVRRGKSGSLIERIFHIGHSPASDMHSSEIDSASQSSKPTTESPTAATTQSKTAENKNGQDPVKTHRHRHSIDDHDHFISQKKSASAGKTPTVSSWKSHLPHFPHFHLPGHHHSPTDPANSPAHNQKSTVERDRLLSPNILNKDRKRSQSVKVNGTRSLARSNSDTSLAEKYGIPREMLGKGATAAVMLAHKEIADDEEEEDRLSCSSSSAHRDNNSEDGSHARSQRRPNSEIGNIKNSDAGSEVDGNERQNSNNHHDHGVVHSNGKKRERLYAVKKFRKRRPEESERDYIKKLSSEFCISSSLHHENIIETVDLIQDESATWYTIMEYCPGGDLFSRIANGPSPLSSDERNCLFRQLVNGIMYLHGVGVVHRDLKPENLLLSADGKILKIADFGTAEVFRVPWCTTNRMIKGVCGSDPYIAPEEWKNDQSQEYEPTKVDIWAIGIIYYVMIHSTIPWQVAQPHCPHYHYYLSNMGGQYEPIDSLESGPKNVLYGLLDPEPLTRLTLESLILDPWFKEIVFCRPNEEMKHTHHPGVPQGVH